MELVSENSERIILVTGATGRQGGAVYQHLQKEGFKLRALVRDPDDVTAATTAWIDALQSTAPRTLETFHAQP